MRAVFAGIMAGYDVTSLNTFLSIVGLPKLPDSFDTVYVAEIYNAAKEAAKEKLLENCRRTVLAVKDEKFLTSVLMPILLHNHTYT